MNLLWNLEQIFKEFETKKGSCTNIINFLKPIFCKNLGLNPDPAYYFESLGIRNTGEKHE